MIIRILTSQPQSLLRVYSLYTIIGLEMPFDISKAPILPDQINESYYLFKHMTYLFVESIRVYAEGIDMPKRGRYATLPKKMHQRVYPLRVVNVEVPKHIWIGNVCLRMSFMTPIHTGKLDRVADEEDWQIVEDEILISLFGKEPRGPSTYITDGITRTFLPSDGRYSL